MFEIGSDGLLKKMEEGEEEKPSCPVEGLSL
jgi:hypothetical protein